jgi:hypothetical protein
MNGKTNIKEGKKEKRKVSFNKKKDGTILDIQK